MFGFSRRRRGSPSNEKAERWAYRLGLTALLIFLVATGCVREFDPEKKEFQCDDNNPCVAGYTCQQVTVGDNVEFIQRLLGADRLVAQITPYNANPIRANFDLAGIDDALAPLRKTCGW